MIKLSDHAHAQSEVLTELAKVMQSHSPGSLHSLAGKLLALEARTEVIEVVRAFKGEFSLVWYPQGSEHDTRKAEPMMAGGLIHDNLKDVWGIHT